MQAIERVLDAQGVRADALAGAQVEVVIRTPRHGRSAASGAPSLLRVDLGVIATPQHVVEPRPEQDILAEARARGQRRAAEILAGDEMLSAEDFAHLVGATRATVNNWRKAGRVLGLSGSKRGYRYPAWQIDRDGSPFQALPRLFGALGGSEWGVYRFLVQHHPELNGLTGRAALQSGAAAKVVAAAESVAEAFS